jgi:DNA-directed RNA polymerase specialized sigma24 family protein
MMSDENDSVTNWVDVVKSGGDIDDAARKLWERYCDSLVRLARVRLGNMPRGPADEEDVALSVFQSFVQGASDGKFPQLGDRDDLWRLLATITARKASNLRRELGCRKRGGRRADTGAYLSADRHRDGEDAFAGVAGDELTPEFAAMMFDEYRRLFDRLDDESLRVVALLKLEGHSNEEIARSLDCGLRTLERKLDTIRTLWSDSKAP